MIIGFAGRMKSGKGVLTNELVRQGYIKLAFADFLKATIANLYNIDLALLISQQGKAELLTSPLPWNQSIANQLFKTLNIDFNFPIENKLFYTRREALQYIGNDILRKYDNNFHINHTLLNLDHNKNYVCEDFRYQNELDALYNISHFKSFYIIRPAMLEYSNHISETSLNWQSTQHVLINDETEQQLIDNFNSQHYQNQSYEGDNTAFLIANSQSSFYAGFTLANASIHSQNNKLSLTVKNANYDSMKSLAKYLNYTKTIKVDNYKFIITLNNPFIIENLKRWNLNATQVLPPDILQDKLELMQEFYKGTKF